MIALIGDGPVTCSTSMEVDIHPRIIWDVNRYYADLGVSVHATKREIKERYQAVGIDSVRLTYIVKQLLDPEVRRRYDLTPLGTLFWDEYVAMALHRLRTQAISDLRAQGLHEEADQLRREIDAEALDGVDGDGQDARTPEDASSSETAPEGVTPWSYSHYVWHSECQDRDRLREWQGALIQILGAAKQHHQIAVGFCGGHGSEFRPVGYRLVFFLGDEEWPTDALAQRVVSQLHEHQRSESR